MRLTETFSEPRNCLSPLQPVPFRDRLILRRSARIQRYADGIQGAPTPTADGEKASTAKEAENGRKFRSSWNAKEKGSKAGSQADFLSELGKQEYNINVDHGQNSQMLDSVFTGNVLGHKSDIADGSLRGYEFRSLANIVGDYYVAPRFLDAVAMHLVKNVMCDQGCFDGQTRIPLILGIWGGKGQGKTFQTELAFKKLGVEPIIMSAGELEHEWAGTPGRMIRDRYRRAAEVSRVRGKLSCLLINDIDAGIGHFANTQITVNNQVVVGTLMNLCDAPNTVSVGQAWRENDWIPRVPIIVTGNDFSRLFAPLVRDGRMAKFYWEPEREDLVNILHQMYKEDGLSKEDMGLLLDTFPDQPLDFYGALRSATYDNQIRRWIEHEVIDAEINDEDANLAELSRRLVTKEDLPVFEPVDLKVEMLIEEGRRLAQEQEQVKQSRLSEEYMKDTGAASSLIGLKG